MALINTYTLFDKAETSIGALRKMLCLITCVDMRLLEHAPQSELKKYTSLGAAMLFTTVLAFFSAYIAIDYIVPEIDDLALSAAGKKATAVFLALIWMLIIFNLQRFVVAGTSRTADVDSVGVDDVISALPSLIMSIVIGMMVAIPLGVAIFKPEIDMYLRVDQERKLFEQTNKLEELGKPARLHACTEFYRYQAGAELPLIRCLPRSRGEVVPVLPEVAGSDQAADLAEGGAPAAPVAANKVNPSDTSAAPAARPSDPAPTQTDPSSQKVERAPEPASIQELLGTIVKLEENDLSSSKQQQAVNKLGGGLVYRAAVMFEQLPFFAYSFTLLIILVQLTPVLIKLMSAKSAYDYLQDMLNRMVVASGGLAPKMAENYRVAESNPAFGGIEVNAVAVYDEHGEGKPLTLYHRAVEVNERYQQLYKEKMLADDQLRKAEMDRRYRRFQKLSSAT